MAPAGGDPASSPPAPNVEMIDVHSLKLKFSFGNLEVFGLNDFIHWVKSRWVLIQTHSGNPEYLGENF